MQIKQFQGVMDKNEQLRGTTMAIRLLHCCRHFGSHNAVLTDTISAGRRKHGSFLEEGEA
jgi:hypothetical protein